MAGTFYALTKRRSSVATRNGRRRRSTPRLARGQPTSRPPLLPLAEDGRDYEAICAARWSRFWSIPGAFPHAPGSSARDIQGGVLFYNWTSQWLLLWLRMVHSGRFDSRWFGTQTAYECVKRVQVARRAVQPRGEAEQAGFSELGRSWPAPRRCECLGSNGSAWSKWAVWETHAMTLQTPLPREAA